MNSAIAFYADETSKFSTAAGASVKVLCPAGIAFDG